MSDTISMGGVSAVKLKLLGEDVLVRALAVEETRASGLVVPYAARESFGRGSEFYGVVVAVGPGRLVERGPSAEAVGRAVREALEVVPPWRGESDYEATREEILVEASRRVSIFVREHTKTERVPLPWKPGDRVLCRQGFGPEVELREGKHHVIGRGNAEHGHGVIAAWDAGHTHCWHLTAKGVRAECACGESLSKPREATALHSCASCPPGERLAEAVTPGAIYAYKHGSAIGAGPYEQRPEVDDGK